MLIKIWPGYWKTHMKRMNQRVDEYNGEAIGIGNGRYFDKDKEVFYWCGARNLW